MAMTTVYTILVIIGVCSIYSIKTVQRWKNMHLGFLDYSTAFSNVIHGVFKSPMVQTFLILFITGLAGLLPAILLSILVGIATVDNQKVD